jgi:4-hydroxyphenylacetate 3-monooxygenase
VLFDSPPTDLIDLTMMEYVMPQHPEAILEGKRRPFTGSEFLESLRDGREVYIYGEQVEDVTTHPAFRNAAVSVAQLYDALHDPKTKDVLTAMTDTRFSRLPTPARM